MGALAGTTWRSAMSTCGWITCTCGIRRRTSLSRLPIWVRSGRITSTCGPGRGSRMTGWIWLTWAVARAATMRGVARIRAACGEGGGTFSLFFSPSPARALPSLRPTFGKSARARERGRARARRERFFVQIAAWSTFAQAAMRSGVCSASLVSSRARPTKLPSRTARDSTAA